ncbi:MAG: thiamine pyrophosphate-dependent enzyme, partial [Chloroflexota bacterium]|nr:thiamine pyrophosphate-dependent enzyme [Chloroflexota bacterium]
ACIAAARLAHAYRDRFHKDFMIDLIGYRRWGHNEGDDPSLTQPTMYARIATHPTVRELWAAELVRRGVVTEADVAAVLANYTKELQAALAEIQAQATRSQGTPTESTAAPPATAPPTETTAAPPDTAPPVERAPAAAPVDVPAVSLATLADLNAALTALPPGFTPHPRLERLILNPRREVFLPDADGRPRMIDWGHAELLAFATILADGTPIRLTGQDTERGTFSQRHAVLHDYTTGEPYIALQTLSAAKASFEVRDSPLSETAAVGFEYGYSVQAPDAFVLWEAQYGDFINGAQVIVDQFIVSARAKWGQLPSLVLLLPHAYEGQGPEHSSGRLERFLELAAEGNIRVAACTTAAQYFHLLRRQAASLAHDARPLIIMTPKSLLRHPLATSPPAALEDEAGFLPVLDDPFFAAAPRDTVRRAILCTGKVYVDLASDARRGQTPGLTLIRVEELYPFPAQELKATLDTYPALREVFWTQEEPRNMGAWTFVQTRIEAIVHQLPGLQGSSGAGVDLQYVGRGERASPAEGSPGRHAAEQARIIDAVYAGLAPTGKPGADEVGAIATQVAAAAARTGSGGD